MRFLLRQHDATLPSPSERPREITDLGLGSRRRLEWRPVRR